MAPNGAEGFFPTNYVKLEGHSQLLSVELGVDPQAQDVDLQGRYIVPCFAPGTFLFVGIRVPLYDIFLIWN